MLMGKFKNLRNNLIFDTKSLLFLIIIFGIILRFLFFSGIGASDDLYYTKYAYNFGKGTTNYTYNSEEGIDSASALTLSTRIGILFPTLLSYKIFGVNDFSSVIFVLLTGVGNIILIYFFGRLLFNENVGLMASFLLAIFPLEVIHSSKLLSDIPSAFFMALGIYLFLYSEIKKKNKIYYLMSGVFIGIGYLIRESAVLIALFFLIYVLFYRRIKKEYFLVPLGFILIFAIEPITLYKLTGDPFFRFTTVNQYLLDFHVYFNYFGRLSYPEGLFHYPYIILTDNTISYFYILIFITIIYLIVTKKRKAYVLMLWFFALLLYLSFGSSSFFRYVPFKATPRYLSIITIPGIVLLAFFLTEKKKLIKKIVKPVSLSVLLITSFLYSSISINNDPVDNLKALYPYIKNSKKLIYVDTRSKDAIDYLSGYNNSINVEKFPADMSNLSNVYIIVNKAMIKASVKSNKKIKFPNEISNPPKKWEIIKEIGKSWDDKAVIYYAP